MIWIGLINNIILNIWIIPGQNLVYFSGIKRINFYLFNSTWIFLTFLPFLFLLVESLAMFINDCNNFYFLLSYKVLITDMIAIIADCAISIFILLHFFYFLFLSFFISSLRPSFCSFFLLFFIMLIIQLIYVAQITSLL